MSYLSKLKNKHSAFRGSTGIEPDSNGSHRVTYPVSDGGAGERKLLRAGWIFLAVAALAAIVVLVALLAPNRKNADIKNPSEEKPAATAAPAFSTENEKAEPFAIGRLNCDFTAPAELSFGVAEPVDFSGMSSAIQENVRAAGWGEVVCSRSEDGSLLITAANPPVFTGKDYDAQTAFLKSNQPENYARTFLQDSGIVSTLSGYGFSMGGQAKNNKGEITFSGTGISPQSVCSISFSFLYTGEFNQARLSAEKLNDSLITSDIISLKKAASKAVSWNAVGTCSGSAVEIRSIRGIPFYAFSLEEGGEAYALAISEEALSASQEALAVYNELMHSGITEYVETSGGE